MRADDLNKFMDKIHMVKKTTLALKKKAIVLIFL